MCASDLHSVQRVGDEALSGMQMEETPGNVPQAPFTGPRPGYTECTRLLPLREHACLERIAIILFACCTEAAVVPICSRSTRRCDKSQERRTRTSRLPRRACCNSCPRDSWTREHAARARRARASLCPSRRSASSALLPWTLRPFPAPAGHVSLERGCPQKHVTLEFLIRLSAAL